MAITYHELGDFSGKSFPCSCGRSHSIDIDQIIIESGALSKVNEVVANYNVNKLFLVADSNTYSIAGKAVQNNLEKAGYDIASHVFTPKGQLIPNEKALADLVLSIPAGTQLVIAVGSGTINDLSRYMAYKLGVPYIMVATAPSMDGFVSTVSPLIVNDLKVTYPAAGPRAVIGDLDILCNAPAKMIYAGLGDILGKYTSLCDWQLSRIINDEYYCPEIVELMKSAIAKCTEDVEGLKARKPSAIKSLMEGLVLSGIAMSFSGNSRPASGAEHHLAHFWEMNFLFAGKEPVLHGTKVGITTIAILKLYDLVKDLKPDRQKALAFVEQFDDAAFKQTLKEVYHTAAADIIKTNDAEDRTSPILHKQRLEKILSHWDEIVQTICDMIPVSADDAEQMLKMLGAAYRPIQVGIDRETVHNSLLYAKELRTRYTVLQMLWDLGELEHYADQVTEFMTRNEEEQLCSTDDEIRERLKNIRCFILDMDGTFYLSDRLLDGSIDFINKVKESGRDYHFYTNNSSKNAAHYEEKLKKMGCPSHVGKVLISNEVLIDYLKEHTSHKKFFVLGTEFLKDDFKKAGYLLDEQNPDAVIVGFDTSLVYDKLTAACNLIKNGIPVYGVNPDFVCPLDQGGFLPDCGSISELIYASTGVRFEFFGKPSRHTLDYILSATGYEEDEIAFVGDRLYTDIAIGEGTRALTILVLSGETTPEMLLNAKETPDLICKGLPSLTPLL